MAQHDYVVSNQSGSSFRADLNNALAAIVSQNSGASEPSTTYAYQFWADTTNNLLKIRNAANSAWITLRELDGTMVVEDGTAAAPGISFAADTNTGIYRVGADQLGIATNGTQRLVVDSTGQIEATSLGTAAAPTWSFVGDLNTGMWSPAADTVAISTGGSERVRVTSSGQWLVGTSTSLGIATSLGGQLQVADASVGIGSITTFANSANGGYLMLGKSRGATVGSYTVVQNNDQLGTIRFAGADGTDLESFGASIEAYVDGTPGSNDLPGRLVFSTTADGASSPTERMRISQGGEVSIGSNIISGTPLSVRDSSGGSAVIRSDSTTAQGTGWYLFYGTSNSGAVLQGWLRGDGTYGSRPNVYGGTSDAKLKENIVDANSQWHDIKAIQVKKFNFIGDDLCQIGVIAQQVEEVSPGLVDENIDRDKEGNDLGTVTKSVKYSVLYMKAVKALQEAMERIETLEAKVAALESA